MVQRRVFRRQPQTELTVVTGMGRLETVLATGGFAVTAEITPPLSSDPEELLKRATPLKGLADAVNVTDGANARIAMAPLAAAAILARSGIEPVVQFTCRDRNRLALQADLLGAAALGIRNYLMLGGDDPKVGDQPETKPVFDLDSRALLATAQQMQTEGKLPSGRDISGKPRFFLGCADMPVDPAPEWQPKSLAAKVEAGARFVQTQFCFDAGVARRYAARLVDAGLDKRASVLIGIGPVASARGARWMRENLFGTIMPDSLIARLEGAADQASEGLQVCLDLMSELSEVPGIAGVHLMAPRNPSALRGVIEAWRARAPSAKRA
jgi:methylenetetrahydrofolate reductase (NADPH)